MAFEEVHDEREASSLFHHPGLLFFASAQHVTAQQPDSTTRPELSPRETLIERANILMAEKRYDAAIQTYQDLLKSEPKSAVFLNMTGIAYLNLSNFDQAKKYFERSSKADKKYLSAVNNLGMVWYYQKNYRKAIREYKRAACDRPGPGRTPREHGVCVLQHE